MTTKSLNHSVTHSLALTTKCGSPFAAMCTSFHQRSILKYTSFTVPLPSQAPSPNQRQTLTCCNSGSHYLSSNLLTSPRHREAQPSTPATWALKQLFGGLTLCTLVSIAISREGDSGRSVNLACLAPAASLCRTPHSYT